MTTPVPEAPPAGPSPELTRPARLAALRRAELLDTPADAAFDRLTRLATTVLGVPVSLVSLVDADRQFFKSAQGLPEPWASARQTGLRHSFCQHVVAGGAPLVVRDARDHALVRDNAAIDDIGVVAYAGFPVRSSDGEVIGSLCAIDHEARAWTEVELGVLADLASLAHTELSMRAALREAHDALAAAQRAMDDRAAIVESSLDGIFTVDTDGRCTLANPAALAVLGFTPDELLGENIHELVHHRYADGTPFPEAHCRIYGALRDGLPVAAYETTFWRRDGTSFPVECTSAPLFVDDRVAGAVVTFRDVSDRAAAAEALRESEMKFRAIFEDAGTGLVITDLQGRLLDCNAAYETITGHARADLRDQSFDHVTHPDDVAEQRRLGEALVSGEVDHFRMDKRYVRPVGSTVLARLTVSLVRDAADAPKFLVAIVEDVTLQRRTEAAMRVLADAGAVLASSLEYETTLREAARHAIPALGDACIVDLVRADGSMEGLCAHVDPACEATLRTARRSPVRDRERTDDALVIGAEPTARGIARGELHALGLRSVLRVPLHGRHGLLGLVTFAAADRRYDDADARLAGELAARMTTAIENARLYREARAATQVRDEVLAVVSHDLRNPVHTIGMSASFLLELAPPENDMTRRQLEVIRRSAGRADRLIRDLLDITRIENGQLRLERAPVPVAELLDEAVQTVASAAAQRQITIAVTPPPADAHVTADRHRLLQALDNLLGNAVKFTPPGGHVTLVAIIAADTATFAVGDTGPGVSPAEQQDLFRPFWQARRVDRRGVGLGLSIVKGIVDAHGGQLEVDSDGRTGTTMRITLPASRADVPAP